MKRLFSKLIPQGLAGRFVLLLVIALVLANLIALFLLVSESRRFDREAQDTRQVERVITLISILETVDPAIWPRIMAESANRMMQANIEATPLVRKTGIGQRAIITAAALKQAFPDRRVHAEMLVRQNLRFRLNQRKDARTENPPPEIAALGISVELKSRLGDVFWLNSVSVTPGRTNGAGLR
ncbi:MAG: hypothetical protein ACRCT6_08285, partial [Notoacmeibacter sp.]